MSTSDSKSPLLARSNKQFQMLGKIISERYYCGIDVGSETIKAGILKIKDISDIELIGVYEQKTYGFNDNAVSDLDEFSDCIHRTIYELTKKAGVKLKEVQLGLSGSMIESRQTNTAIPLVDKGSKVISHRDIKKINDNARLLGVQMEEEILHDFPQHYKIDDVNSAVNPLGLYGRKLDVHSLMIVVDGNRIRNITKAVHQAGYEVTNVFFSPFVSSEVVLSEEEKKEGCLFIDLGSKFTNVLIFKDGVLQFLERINIGGSNITSRIADKIDLPFDLAEEIKKSYAIASGFDQHCDEEILIKKNEGYMPIKRGVIYEAIQLEIENLIGSILRTIDYSGLKDKIKAGVTIVGGGALLPGFIERLSQDTHMPVKLGKLNLALEKQLSYTAIFSSVVGLAKSGFKKTFRYSFASNSRSHWTKHLASRVKELYQEYF